MHSREQIGKAIIAAASSGPRASVFMAKFLPDTGIDDTTTCYHRGKWAPTMEAWEFHRCLAIYRRVGFPRDEYVSLEGESLSGVLVGSENICTCQEPTVEQNLARLHEIDPSVNWLALAEAQR